MSRCVAILFLFALLFSACAPASVQPPEVSPAGTMSETPVVLPATVEMTVTPEVTPTLTLSPTTEVETSNPAAWELVGDKGQMAQRKIDTTLWVGTDGEQQFVVNPEYAGDLRRAILMHIYAINWAADETFKARYSKYETWEEAIDADPEKLWDIYLDEPHPGSYSSGEWGTVQPVKVRQPVSLTSLSLELVAPEKARPLVDKKGGYTEQHGYFAYQLETIVGSDGKPMVQMNFTNSAMGDDPVYGWTAIRLEATIDANARMWRMGLNMFEQYAGWMAGGFGGDDTRVIMDGGVLSMDTTQNLGELKKSKFDSWANGEPFVVPRER